MFSGIITACVSIRAIEEKDQQRLLTIERPKDRHLKIGESVNIDGVCSTVIGVSESDFQVSSMPETLRVTTMKSKHVSDRVNIEFPLTLHTLLSGHIVTGHIDAVGTVRSIVPQGDAHLITIDHPQEQSVYVIPKGSIALNGVSLTLINPQSGQFSIGIIPYTWENTNLSDLKVGDPLNIEYDILGKYVIRSLKNSEFLREL